MENIKRKFINIYFLILKYIFSKLKLLLIYLKKDRRISSQHKVIIKINML